MPPNMTRIIQSRGQNALRHTKLFCRNGLLSPVLKNGKEGVAETLRKFGLKDAIINLAVAWEKLCPIIIAKCWDNILKDSNEDIHNAMTLI